MVASVYPPHQRAPTVYENPHCDPGQIFFLVLVQDLWSYSIPTYLRLVVVSMASEAASLE